MTTPPLPAAPPGRIVRKACLRPSAVPSRLTSSCLRTAVGVEVDDQAGDLDAGVVDQDVEPAEEARSRSATAASQLASSVTSRCTNPCPSPRAGQRLGDLGPEVVLQVGDDDRGAGGGERVGHPLAEALGPSGDEGLAAGEVEIGHDWLLEGGGWVVAVTTWPASLDDCQDFSGHLSRKVRSIVKKVPMCPRTVTPGPTGGGDRVAGTKEARRAPRTSTTSAATSSPSPRCGPSASSATPAPACARSPTTPSSATASCTTTSPTSSS